MTLDKLAVIIQQEFLAQREFLASKKEIHDEFGKVYGRFNKIDDEITWIHGSLELIQREVSEIKEKLKNIIYRHEFETLKNRIEAIEKKVGLKN